MLQTERIRFELLQPKYVEDLEILFCENNTVMQSTFKGRVFTKKEFETLIQKEFIQSKEDTFGFRCLISLSDNKLNGVSGLHEFHYLEKKYYEFGFILTEDYWGKGLATEIGNFWFKYAEEELSLTELIATVSPKNIASKKVLKKLQMKPLGKFHFKERGARLIFIKRIALNNT